MSKPNANVEIVHVKDILDEVRGDGSRTVEQQLSVIFDRFNIAVRAIDPTITGCWVGYETERPNHPSYIAFERGKPLFGIRRE
jgi:hypothetical protein